MLIKIKAPQRLENRTWKKESPQSFRFAG